MDAGIKRDTSIPHSSLRIRHPRTTSVVNDSSTPQKSISRRLAEMALGTPSWLNLDFAEGILRRSEGDSSIQVIDIFSKPATNKGDNYTSDMIRAVVEFSRNKGDRKVTEKKSIIVKVTPTEGGMRQELVAKSNLFETEISMMSCTLKKMNDVLGPGYRLNGHCLHVQKENPALLVIEDLAQFGFRMADRQAGLDLEHSLLAIRGLARFHASSVALCEKEPKYKQTYTKGIFSSEHPEEMREFFVQGIKSLANEVEKWPELGKRYADKIRATSEVIYSQLIELVKCREDNFNVINHGDCWVNNMMFRYDNDGKPVEHIFVDFQLPIYTSPAVDLQYFLSTSLSVNVYENHMEQVLEEYLNTLTSTMKRIGCKTTPPTMDELKRSLKEYALYGLISSYTILPIILVDKSEVKDINELMQKDGTYENNGYKSELYRKIMVKRMPMYEEMGLLGD